MGYSCTAKAALVRDAVCKLVNDRWPNKISNSMPDGGFWETGRENDDGAITGTVWKPVDETHVRRKGSFRIDAEGKIIRWPGLPRDLLRQAEKEGMAKFYATNICSMNLRGLIYFASLI